MDALIYFIIIFLILSVFLNIIAYAWPFLLIMFIVYEIWKYFKLKKIRKQYEDTQSQYSSQYQSQSQPRNDNPDIIDVEYKVVDEEKTGDDN
ncbi:hypothetical protein [uncultured Catenibacterium sp.]|uniref:hypothetical protein n=1 Tax=uncultured Catenibacterium sp. TaxID=286142 RepID=UPI0025F34F2C|nr:hypothetical protein [uncultured Catenibacterium sp.]